MDKAPGPLVVGFRLKDFSKKKGPEIFQDLTFEGITLGDLKDKILEFAKLYLKGPVVTTSDGETVLQEPPSNQKNLHEFVGLFCTKSFHPINPSGLVTGYDNRVFLEIRVWGALSRQLHTFLFWSQPTPRKQVVPTQHQIHLSLEISSLGSVESPINRNFRFCGIHIGFDLRCC